MEKNKLNSGCTTCRYGSRSLYKRPCDICQIKSENSRWVPNEEIVTKKCDYLQKELLEVAISYANHDIDLEIALDWYSQILEQDTSYLIVNEYEDEEDLMDGDLEDQFERLMK